MSGEAITIAYGYPDASTIDSTLVEYSGFKLTTSGDTAVFAQRSDWEGSTVVAVHNLAGRDAQARVEIGGDGSLVDLFHDEEHELDGGALSLELSPYDARWFRVRRPGRRLPP